MFLSAPWLSPSRLVLTKALRAHGSFLGSELKCLGMHSWVHKRDIESHKERERALISPLGLPSVALRRHPTPSHIGWHRNASWPEEATSDDVTREDHV